MAYKYSEDQLKDFVEAIRDASVAIDSKNPSYYLVSLNGGLPLFDILTIVDRNVDPGKAIYFPGSSKIQNSAQVMTRCFENFFLERQDLSDEQKRIVSLDEVVCGSSVERLFNAYNAASRKIARANLGNSQREREHIEAESAKLRNHFPLSVFGIKEIRDKRVKMNTDYLKRVKNGEVMEFPTGKILTMDDPDYETVEFDHPNSSGFSGQGYFPKVRALVLRDSYLNLLGDVSRLSGVNPESINPVRARVSSDCAKYSQKPNYH